MYRVLIVEDSASVRETLSALLSRIGNMSVLEADSIHQAEQVLAAGGIDVILLDLLLPDANNLTGLQRLLYAAPSVPIVVLTGLTGTDLEEGALRGGAQGYLEKAELSGKELVRTLRHAILRQEYRMMLRPVEQSMSDTEHLLREADEWGRRAEGKPAEAEHVTRTD